MIKQDFNRVEKIFIGTKQVNKIIFENNVIFVKPTEELTYTILPSGFAVDGIIDETIEYISIPSKIKGTNDVPTLIKEGAFRTFPIKSIIIPNTIVYILGGKEYGYGAFEDCNELSFVYFGKNVQEIGGYSFYGCNKLKSIHLPYYLRKIGSSAFSQCISLENITFDGNLVTTIGHRAFEDCDSLISIVIPNSVVEIGTYAFYSCDSLRNVTIGEGVTTIPYSAFSKCRSLSSITIPKSITKIDDMAFNYCDSLTNVYYKGTQSQWNAIAIGDYNENLTNATIHFNWQGE